MSFQNYCGQRQTLMTLIQVSHLFLDQFYPMNPPNQRRLQIFF